MAEGLSSGYVDVETGLVLFTGHQVCHPHLSPGETIAGPRELLLKLWLWLLLLSAAKSSHPAPPVVAAIEGLVRGDMEVTKENLPAEVPHVRPFRFVPDELALHPLPFIECLL